jgi:hypothetical protein
MGSRRGASFTPALCASPSEFGRKRRVLRTMKILADQIQNCNKTNPNRLPTVVLHPQPPSEDEQLLNSVEELAHSITEKCVSCLLDLVQQRNPLQAMEDSLSIWLRPEGALELVRKETDEHAKATEGCCFIESFASLSDATPDSQFHRRIWPANVVTLPVFLL